MAAPRPASGTDDLSTRDLEILKAIVQDFIVTGDPVGSQAIAPRCEVSPATVRNAMADLEALGFLEKPHTSAGRVPTDRAYRLYVDALLRVRSLAPKDLERIDRAVQGAPREELAPVAGKLLHEISRHAAVVVAPRFDHTLVQRIEFVKLREDRVLAIFVTAAGLVQNRLVQLDVPVEKGELEHAANYLSSLLGDGLTLDAVQARIRTERDQEQAALDELRRKSLDLGEKALAGSDPEPQVVIEGEESFLDAPEFAADLAKMRKLYAELAQKERLVDLLARAVASREIQIFIGTESEFSAAAGVSLVASPYQSAEGVVGALAVIGPTRMNYGRVISLVEATARAVSRSLD